MEYVVDVEYAGAQLRMQKLLLLLLCEDKVKHVGTPPMKHMGTPLGTQTHYQA